MDDVAAGYLARFARRISPRAEPWLVLGVPVALFLGLGVLGGLRLAPNPRDFTTGRLASTLGVEFAAAALLVPLLRARGWTIRQCTRPLELPDAARGIGVLLVCYLVSLLVWVGAAPWVGSGVMGHIANTRFTASASVPVKLAVAAIDPVFEEFLLVAYPAVAFAARGRRFVVLLSVAVRLLLHQYQGLLALFTITPLGLVFVLYYLWTKRLWPVIAAHVMQDVLALLSIGVA